MYQYLHKKLHRAPSKGCLRFLIRLACGLCSLRKLVAGALVLELAFAGDRTAGVFQGLAAAGGGSSCGVA